jgi:hypothetical protein
MSRNRNEITIPRQQEESVGLYAYRYSPYHKEVGTLSAQAIDLDLGIDSVAGADRIVNTQRVADSTVLVSGVPFEVVYQALFAPEPTPEDILREQFLLECD